MKSVNEMIKIKPLSNSLPHDTTTLKAFQDVTYITNINRKQRTYSGLSALCLAFFFSHQSGHGARIQLLPRKLVNFSKRSAITAAIDSMYMT